MFENCFIPKWQDKKLYQKSVSNLAILQKNLKTVCNGHICDQKQKFFLGGFKYWDESRPSREDYRSGLHHGNKSLTAWPNPVKTNNKLHHLCYYYYMLEVIQDLNFRSGINNKHSRFLEWWNTTKSLSNIWQHFSCLGDCKNMQKI